MPKKTRQEKILARLRRLEQEKTAITAQTEQNSAKTVAPKISYQFEGGLKTQETVTAKVTADYSYVYKDLTKSLLFAAVAIIFQFLLAVFVVN